MPIRSSCKLSINCEMARLAFSKRLGAISPDSILFETSSKIIKSAPLCFSSTIFDPICGSAMPKIKKAKATTNKTNFRRGVVNETSGTILSTTLLSPNDLMALYFHRSTQIKSNTKAGIAANPHKYSICAKRNILG